MNFLIKKSLKRRIMFWIGILVIGVFSLVIFQTFKSFSLKLEEAIYNDLADRNHGYINTIYSTLMGKADLILALRDDLEMYETVGQMWIHIAAHVGEKFFDDKHNLEIYTESFQKKLQTYMEGSELAPDKITPQIQTMLDNIKTKKNAFGDGMKFFYIGIDAEHTDKKHQEYDSYQDSSLWVPDYRVDKFYDPLVRPWYLAGQKSKRDGVIFTEPYAERRTKEALIAASTKINIKGKVGTLAGGISIRPIMEVISERIYKDADLEILSPGTADSKAKYVYSSRSALLGDNFKNYDDPETIKTQANKDIKELYQAIENSKSGVVEWVIDGEEKLVAYETVPDIGWRVFNIVSKKKMLADAVSIRQDTVRISIIGLLLLLVIIYLSLRGALKPVDRISRELKDIAETGNLSKRVKVGRKDEVGQIALAINDMLENTAAPVQNLAQKAAQIADGDLTLDVQIGGKGDIKTLTQSFGIMLQNLKSFAKEVTENAKITADSARDLFSSSEAINTANQEVNRVINELEKGVEITLRTSKDAKEKSQKTSEFIHIGSKSATQISENMESITLRTKEGAEKIDILGQQSKQIGAIVSAIEDVTTQTALLALNASIEAARAGEHGRGFAVVADEVRKLSTESQNATAQISQLILTIQKEIDASVILMSDNTKKVDEGAIAVQDALESFTTIPELVRSVNLALEEVAKIAEENAENTQDLTSSSKEVNSSMQKVGTAAKHLAEGAQRLGALASQFKVDT